MSKYMSSLLMMIVTLVENIFSDEVQSNIR